MHAQPGQLRRAGLRPAAFFVALVATAILALTGCGSSTPPKPSPRATPANKTVDVQRWLSNSPFYVAHRGGDADWTQGTAYAYAQAAAWRPDLALEVPVWLTSDGVWVVSETGTTGPVFGSDYTISAQPWSVLSKLRSLQGGYPMARLVQDVLDPYRGQRVIFVDDKPSVGVGGLLDILAKYGGPDRFVIKCFYAATSVADVARRAGYVTWGYYFTQNMDSFTATQTHFDILGLSYDAPAADFQVMVATGKPVIAHIIATAAQAKIGLDKGARGLMVSGVTQVVPR